MRLLFLISIILISYGSLYPFNFQTEGTFFLGDLFLLSHHDSSSNGFSNIAANIILFIPYGFFGYLSTTTGRATRSNLVVIVILGLLLSYSLQVLQMFLPTRLSEWEDIVWNMIGLTIGGLAAAFFRNILLNSNHLFLRQFSSQGLLIGAWLAAFLIPFVPSLSIDIIRGNVKQLLTDDSVSYLLIFTQMAYWLSVAFLIESLFGGKKGRLIFPLTLLLAVSAKFLLIENPLQIEHLLGGLLSLLVWFPASTLVPSKQTKLQSIALLLLMVTLLNGLFPFEIKATIMAFHWIPFYGFLTGNMLHNLISLCEKVFLYGTLIWLFVAAGNSLRLATTIIAIWLLLLEIAQLFLGEHTPEITDPILVIIISFALFKIKSLEGTLVPQEKAEKLPPQMISQKIKWKKFSLTFSFFALFISIAISFLLALPSIPYNIKELFLYNNNFFAIYIFSLAILWSGVASYLSAYLASKHHFQSLTLVFYILSSGLISFVLLKLSVSSESISDITGSSNMMWQVTEKKIWGDLGAKIFLVINAPGMIAFIEKIIRYLALFTPLILTIAIFNTLFIQDQNSSVHIKKTGKLILVSLPWFFICKLITFDYSSTDNLNELIAKPGEYGLGGGGYLYLLMILIAFNVAFISRPTRFFLSLPRILITLLAVPVGWYLLNKGLIIDFQKYHQTYSGVDFLLGPNRRNLLPDRVLFMRWSLLQIGLVMILTAGQRFASILIIPSRETFTDKSIEPTPC